MLPGVIPSPVGEFAEYVPSTIEIMVIAGVWAIGFFILTVLIKGAVGILLGEVKYKETAGQSVGVRQGKAATT